MRDWEKWYLNIICSMLRVKLEFRNTYLLLHKYYMLVAVKNETSAWRKFSWRESRWGTCLNFLTVCKLAQAITFQTLKFIKWTNISSVGTNYWRQMTHDWLWGEQIFWEDKLRVHRVLSHTKATRQVLETKAFSISYFTTGKYHFSFAGTYSEGGESAGNTIAGFAFWKVIPKLRPLVS